MMRRCRQASLAALQSYIVYSNHQGCQAVFLVLQYLQHITGSGKEKRWKTTEKEPPKSQKML
jgi:hypothetical protein